jgi:hypothetical protein
MFQQLNKLSKAMMLAVAVLCWAAPSAPAIDDLTLNVAPGFESVAPGDTVTVTLNVASLSEAINGVQAMMSYDPGLLILTDIIPTDLGLISPSEGWVEVSFSDVSGALTYAVVINGDSTIADDTVATLTFTAIAEGVTTIAFLPDADPFFTKLTAASDNGTIFPATADSGTITLGCDDGLFCNGLETLVVNACQAGVAPDCSLFADQCNDGGCNESTDSCEAQPINEGLGCDDSDLCTVGDACQAGTCLGVAVDCSVFDDVCNIGTCNPGDGTCGATPTNEGGSCDDLLFCNGVDTCSSGVCVSSGDPCFPGVCDEPTDSCSAPVHISNVELFYPGRFLNQADPSKNFLAPGSIADLSNISNHAFGVNGIRISFDALVTFATTPDAAFSYQWTFGIDTLFSPMDNPGGAVTVTAFDGGGFTVVDIVIVDNHVRQRWLEVTVDAAQITSNGSQLDGELTGNPLLLPSGDGTAGGNALFYIGNMPGDVTGDRKDTLTDVGQIRLRVNPAFSVPIDDIYDIDKSGKIQLTDVGQARLTVNPGFAIPLIAP